MHVCDAFWLSYSHPIGSFGGFQPRPHEKPQGAVSPCTFTFDFVLSMSALTVLLRTASLAGASVNTKMSEEEGAAVSASCSFDNNS